jgi:hypothetical protein
VEALNPMFVTKDNAAGSELSNDFRISQCVAFALAGMQNLRSCKNRRW